MKKYRKFITIIVFLLLILFIFFRVIKVQDMLLKIFYPLEYTEYVQKYSKENGIDEMLVFAMIKVESGFEPNITSSSGAMGLMQLMDNTAKEIAQKIGYDYITKEVLYQPETNIMLGTNYYAGLLKIFNNNIQLSLAAYNAGIGNVNKWITSGIIKEDGSDIENIPFKETNNYVRRILRDYNIYKKLYNK